MSETATPIPVQQHEELTTQIKDPELAQELANEVHPIIDAASKIEPDNPDSRIDAAKESELFDEEDGLDSSYSAEPQIADYESHAMDGREDPDSFRTDPAISDKAIKQAAKEMYVEKAEAKIDRLLEERELPKSEKRINNPKLAEKLAYSAKPYMDNIKSHPNMSSYKYHKNRALAERSTNIGIENNNERIQDILEERQAKKSAEQDRQLEARMLSEGDLEKFSAHKDGEIESYRLREAIKTKKTIESIFDIAGIDKDPSELSADQVKKLTKLIDTRAYEIPEKITESERDDIEYIKNNPFNLDRDDFDTDWESDYYDADDYVGTASLRAINRSKLLGKKDADGDDDYEGFSEEELKRYADKGGYK